MTGWREASAPFTESCSAEMGKASPRVATQPSWQNHELEPGQEPAFWQRWGLWGWVILWLFTALPRVPPPVSGHTQAPLGLPQEGTCLACAGDCRWLPPHIPQGLGKLLLSHSEAPLGRKEGHQLAGDFHILLPPRRREAPGLREPPMAQLRPAGTNPPCHRG